MIEELLERLAGVSLFDFRHFPRQEVHPNSVRAAAAAEAAASQGKFWQMHDLLFDHQDALDAASLKSYAKELDLEPARFDADVESPATLARVEEDLQSGPSSGVEGTPTFSFDGVLYHAPTNLQTMIGLVRDLHPELTDRIPGLRL